jgi:protoporphyrinogen/coproporphyrinogen III oxidase
MNASLNNHSPSPRFAIIGAGISGLACCWYLQKYSPNATIELFEASDQVGGVIQTTLASSMLIEQGADNFATLLPDALRFIEDMRIRDEFISPKTEHRMAQVVCRGKVIPIPNGFSLMQPTQLLSILTTPTLSVQGRMRVLCEYFVQRRLSDGDESVESYAIRRLGRECFEQLIEPIVGGIFTARSETLSMQAAMPQFVAMEREHGGLIRAALAKRKNQSKQDQSARQATGARYDQFLAPKQGMTWWMKAIANQLKTSVRLRHRVEILDKNADGIWTVSGKTNDSSTSSFQSAFDGVVLALPSNRSASLLQRTKPQAAKLLHRIPYASSAIGILAVPRNEIMPECLCFGIVVPKKEQRQCLAISLTSEKYKGRCAEDLVLVRVFMGGAVRPELIELRDDELLAIARSEVKSLLGVSSLPRWQSLIRWNEAMPQYLIGHTQLIQQTRSALGEDATLKLIGNGLEGVGIPQCIKLARQAAEQLASLYS